MLLLGHSRVLNLDAATATLYLQDPLLGCHSETQRDTVNCVNIFCIKLMECFLNEISKGDSKSTKKWNQRVPLPIVCK